MAPTNRTRKIQAAIDDLWMYTGEMFTADAIEVELIEAGIAADVRALEAPWREHVDRVLVAATLEVPDAAFMQQGGKRGRAHRAPRAPPRGDADVAALASGSTVVIAALNERPAAQQPASASPGARPTLGALWAVAAAVPDPEIPVISVTDLGILRGIEWDAGDPATLVVTVTPTYSGCPATEMIMASLRDALAAAGVRARPDRDAPLTARGRPTG